MLRGIMNNKLEYLGKDRWGDKYFYMDVKDDTFVHFTTLNRSNEIIETKQLLLDSPHSGMGAYGTFAVSLTYGDYIPGVQTTHIKADPNDTIVAVEFKTNTVPKKTGTVDEVAFGEQNVNLINPKIISKEQAISKIKSAPVKISQKDNDDKVIYDKALIPQLSIVSKEASYKTLNKYFRSLFE